MTFTHCLPILRDKSHSKTAMHIQELVGQTQTALELIGLCGYKNRCSVNDVYEALFLDKSADNLKKIVQTVNNTEVFTLLVNTAFEMAEQMELNTVSAKAIVDEVTAEITPVVVEVVTPVVEPVDPFQRGELHGFEVAPRAPRRNSTLPSSNAAPTTGCQFAIFPMRVQARCIHTRTYGEFTGRPFGSPCLLSQRHLKSLPFATAPTGPVGK